VAVASVVVILMLVIPMHKVVIDLFMILNLALSVAILLTVVYTPKASTFTSFPRVILFVTLFGLGINISSTRLILSNPATASGHMTSQSNMVQAFANIVTGGNNIVIGLVIFVILIVIQVVVITKGATRVSEVAARFALDSMNSKMFAVDSELNSGSITEEDARAKKREIQRECDFYSAMDGSSKFVSGNVKAGIFITLVNLIGGFIIGMVQYKLTFQQALGTYSNLTIGDGLLSQIPSLMLSFATGLIVTGSSSDTPIGNQIRTQFSADGYVYIIVGAALAIMGIALRNGTQFLLIPVGILCIYFGYKMFMKQQVAAVKKVEEEKKAAADKSQKAGQNQEESSPIAPLHTLSLELGYGLIPLVDKEKGAELLDRVIHIRREAALDLGLIVPGIHIVDNVMLDPNEYCFKIRGIEAGRSIIRMGCYMCMNTGAVTKEMKGEATRDPAFNMPAIWVPEENRAEAEKNGYAVVDPPTIISTHITEILRAHAAEILGRQDVSTILENVKKTNSVVVDEVLNTYKFTYGEIEKVLQNLLAEQVSIRNIVTILETMANFGNITHNTWVLTEKVREALGLQICMQYIVQYKKLRFVQLSQQWTQMLLEHKVEPSDGSEPYVAFDPVDGRHWIKSVSDTLAALHSHNIQPIILCPTEVRQLVYSSTERELNKLVVLSINEVIAAGKAIEIESVGEINV
ncbi:MAG: flagellar biosynthesis protein FlhA, partial [Treponema sp.]|nr:flagellar biosynthesis protein FlhA [Treponema sp.]